MEGHCLAYRAEKERGQLVAELDSMQAGYEGLQKAKVRTLGSTNQ